MAYRRWEDPALRIHPRRPLVALAAGPESLSRAQASALRPLLASLACLGAGRSMTPCAIVAGQGDGAAMLALLCREAGLPTRRTPGRPNVPRRLGKCGLVILAPRRPERGRGRAEECPWRLARVARNARRAPADWRDRSGLSPHAKTRKSPWPAAIVVAWRDGTLELLQRVEPHLFLRGGKRAPWWDREREARRRERESIRMPEDP